MSEVWQKRTIHEFAARIKNLNTSGEELEPLSVTKDRGVVLQSTRFNKRVATDLRKYQIARRGQFVFDPMSMYYGSLGRLDVIDEGVVSPDYVVFEADESVDADFLLSLLRSARMITRYERLSERGNRFGKRRRLYWRVFRDITLEVPPLAEQRKIAAILGAVDQAIDKTQAVIDQVQVVKKALMQDLLTRGLPGRHTRFKQTDIGELPESWDVTTLGHAGQWLSGSTPSKSNPSYWGGDIPWVSPKDMKRLRLDDAIDHVTEAAIANGLRRVPPGVILVVVRGMILAHSFPAAITLVSVTLNQDMKALVVRDCFAPEFVLYWLRLREHQFVQQITTATHGTKRLTSEMLFSHPLPQPPPSEQDEIIEILRCNDEYLATHVEKLAALQTLKQSLMSVLLTGEVRVPLEPTP